MGRMGNEYKTFTGKPEGKGQSRRPRYRWDYNIRMDVSEIGLEGLEWMHLA
jgi:hypothetical protein